MLDARFLPRSEAVMVVTKSRELGLLQTPDGPSTVLDNEVEAPLSISETGRFLVYSKGEMPFFEISQYDLDARQAPMATEHMAPAWCPAISSDGGEIVFASSFNGLPRLYRARIGAETPRLVSDRDEDPSPTT